MNLSSLRNCIMIAHCGSFTKAAEQLLVPQPTLSRQIRELEKELGVTLFIRSRVGVQLTDAGELFLEEVAAIVDRCDNLSALFRSGRGDVRREIHDVLRVGCQPYLNAESVYLAAAEVRRQAPEAEVLLCHGNVPELRNGLLDNRFDAVFSLQVYYDGLPEVRTLPILENRFQVVVSADSPLAGREKVRIKELREERFILLRREFSPIVVDRLISLCMNNGFSPNASHYVSTAEEGLQRAAAEEGIAFLPSQMRMEGMEERFHVRFVDLDEKEADLPLVLAYKEKNPKRALRRLIQAIEARDKPNK